MPYKSNADLPPAVKGNLPEAALTVYRKAYNAAYEEQGEEAAAKIAWTAVKNAGYKKEGGKWVHIEDGIAHGYEVIEHMTFDAAADTKTTSDGYLCAMPRVARTGIQLYRGFELGLGDKEVVRVYRPDDEVFDKASAGSFAHRPVTVEHPKEFVNASNWKQLAVGHTTDKIMRDGEYICVPIMVLDAKAIGEISSGRRQLSAGYTMMLDWAPGVTPTGEAYDAVQKEIRVNHIAITKAARGGSQLRIGDAYLGDMDDGELLQDDDELGDTKLFEEHEHPRDPSGKFAEKGGGGGGSSGKSSAARAAEKADGKWTAVGEVREWIRIKAKRGESLESIAKFLAEGYWSGADVSKALKELGAKPTKRTKFMSEFRASQPSDYDDVRKKSLKDSPAVTTKTKAKDYYLGDDDGFVVSPDEEELLDQLLDSSRGDLEMPHTILIGDKRVSVEEDAAPIILKAIKDADNVISDLTAKITGLDADIERLKKQIKDGETALTGKTKEHNDLQVVVTAKDAEINTLKQQVSDAALTPAKLDLIVKERAEIIDKSRKLLDNKLVTDGKTNTDIMRQVVDARMGAAAKGYSDEHVRVAFDTLTVTTPTNDALADALSRRRTAPSYSLDAREELNDKRANFLENAWKNPTGVAKQ